MAKKKQQAVVEVDGATLEVQTLAEQNFNDLIQYSFIDDINPINEDLVMGTAWQTPFKIRTTRPTQGETYAKAYANYEHGGWSGAIVCSNDYCNCLPNCVGYANGRFNEIYGEMTGYVGSKYPWFNCNACNFIQRAREFYPELEISSDPVPGAMIVWSGGWGDYGHVAVVERINADGSILTTESAYGGSFFYTATRYPANQWGMGGTYKFQGFILNPAVPKIAPGVTPDVPRDAKKNQLKCDIPDLRVRTSPSLADDSNIIDLLPEGVYYNYYEVKVADNYEWFRIAENQWCARVDENAPWIYPYDLFPTKYDVNCTKYKEGIIETDKAKACGYDTVNVVVKPNKGYTCTGSFVNGKAIVGGKFKMPRMGSVTITATFEKSAYNVICEEADFGKTKASPSFADKGAEVVVNIFPDEGYRLSKLYSEQVVIKDNKFIMPAEDVKIFSEFELINNPIYEVGTKVKITKVGNSKSDGSGSTVFHIGGEYIITNIVWNSNLTLAEFPYQLSAWDGTIIGYYKEDSLEFAKEPIPPSEFTVGETVKIKGRGNSKPDGSGNVTFGIGWKEEILSYSPNDLFPYKLGRNQKVQGYYKAKDLKKL